MTNYRSKIEEILSRHARAGEDLNESVLAGSPDVIDAEEAIAISEWIRNRANKKWGYDPRHRQIASEILRALGGD